MDTFGYPKTKDHQVPIVGEITGETVVVAIKSASDKIGTEAQVLWSSSGIDRQLYITTCDEIPSQETCIKCVYKFNCNFSRSREF